MRQGSQDRPSHLRNYFFDPGQVTDPGGIGVGVRSNQDNRARQMLTVCHHSQTSCFRMASRAISTPWF